MAIDGGFEAWPRSARIPRRRTVAVQFGRVITPSEYVRLDDAALINRVTTELASTLEAARRLRRQVA
jgi:hypothetical protein